MFSNQVFRARLKCSQNLAECDLGRNLQQRVHQSDLEALLSFESILRRCSDDEKIPAK